MSSNHSSASVCDFTDADQDCLDLDVLPPPAASTPPATVAATPAASEKFRRCLCGRRMSCLSYDHHSLLLFL